VLKPRGIETRHAGGGDAVRPDQLVACKIARSLFNVPTRIARCARADFLDNEQLLSDDNFAVSHASARADITDYNFATGRFPSVPGTDLLANAVTLVGVRAQSGGLLVDKPISAMREQFAPGVDARIAQSSVSIKRSSQVDTIVEAGGRSFRPCATETFRR